MPSDRKLCFGSVLLATAVLIAAAACGGGGGKSKTATPTPNGEIATAATGTVVAGTPATPNAQGTPATPNATQEAAAAAGGPTVSPQDSATIAAAVDAVFAAVQQKDYERMRALSAESLRGEVSNRELDRVFRCFAGGTLGQPAAPQISISGNRANVTVTFQSTSGTPRTVEAEDPWQFQRQEDGTWLLRDLPPCPGG